MDTTNILTDELVFHREKARKHKNYRLSDLIRNELDKRGTYIMDTAEGQVIYHTSLKSRAEFEDMLLKDKKANQLFDSWLASMNHKKSRR